VCSSISWYLNLVLLTWQKIAPLFILSQLSINYGGIVFVGVVNLFFGVFGAIGQTQFRSLIAYSSIAHMGWIVCLIHFSRVAFFYYFVCYLVVVSPVVGIFMGSNLFSFKGLMGGTVGRFNIFTIVLLLLRISGIPPFLGFFMKAYALYSIMLTTAFVVALVFCLFAAVRLRYYLNLCFIILMSTSYRVRDEHV
jgi:NADH:ubiquinone oxidoreductase subunit 2 (subunit N)